MYRGRQYGCRQQAITLKIPDLNAPTDIIYCHPGNRNRGGSILPSVYKHPSNRARGENTTGWNMHPPRESGSNQQFSKDVMACSRQCRGKLGDEAMLMFVLRHLSALLPLSFAIAGSAQTTVKVFTSPDGVFGFKYSPVLVDCTKPVQTRPTSSGVPKVFVGSPPPLSIPDSCVSQGGMCNDGGGQGRTLACFAYPKDRFRDKPTFVAAAFFVTDIDELQLRLKQALNSFTFLK
jgi:hypothetical protein